MSSTNKVYQARRADLDEIDSRWLQNWRFGDLNDLQVEQSTRSTNRSIQNLAKSGIPGETIRESLISQSVELIFTAHPTQVSAQT